MWQFTYLHCGLKGCFLLLICFPDEDRGGHCISSQAAVIMQLTLLLWSPSPSQSLGTSCCCAAWCFLNHLLPLAPNPSSLFLLQTYFLSHAVLSYSPQCLSVSVPFVVFFLQFSVLQNKAALIYHWKCKMDRERLVFHENCFVLFRCH